MIRTAILIFGLCAASSTWALCAAGADWLDQSRRASSPEQKIRHAEASLDECASLDAALLIARAYAAGDDYNAALGMLTEAQDYVASDRDTLSLLMAQGELSLGAGDFCGAASTLAEVESIEQELGIRPADELRLAVADARQGEVLDAKTIACVLSASRSIRARSVAVRPRVNLAINFEFDSARLTARGREQARALLGALETAAFSSNRILVIGHTDAQGSADYNRDLSRRRAIAVRDLLIAENASLGRRLRTEGRGEEELLSRGNSSRDHAANRRVQIELDR